MSDERKELIDGLREFADFLESHPGAPTPSLGRFDVFCAFKEEFQNAIKAVGGKMEKQHEYQSVMALRRKFGPLEYDINISRSEICDKVVTGKRIVAAVPAVEAIPEHEEEVIEWKCGTVLL